VCVVCPLVLGPFLWRIGLTRFSAIFVRSSRVSMVIVCVVSGGFSVVSAMISLYGAIMSFMGFLLCYLRVSLSLDPPYNFFVLHKACFWLVF